RGRAGTRPDGASVPRGRRRRRAPRRRAPLQGGRERRRSAQRRPRQGRDRLHRAPARDREPGGALPRHDRRRVVRPRPDSGGAVTGTLRVYRWELSKLLAQKRTYLGLGVAMVVPIVFVVVLVLQTGGPNDVPLGRYIRDTGLAVPFVVLFFMSIWGLPLITALVAGDIVASESHNGTLKTI